MDTLSYSTTELTDINQFSLPFSSKQFKISLPLLIKVNKHSFRSEGYNEMALENQGEIFVACEIRHAGKSAICNFKILHRFSLLTNAFNLIGTAFKFLLTLSLSQVACESSSSTLKPIKNRMKSTLSSNNLNSFMVVAVEKDLLMNLDCDDIIDKVTESSELLWKSLTI